MIGIIDYGMGNIQSVLNAFERLGHSAQIVTTGRQLKECTGMVLPGVGAFSKAIENLHKMDLVEPIKDVVAAKTPLLGICLGLQLLADESEEYGKHKGLGLIPGQVRMLPVKSGYHLPHIGWNEVKISPRVDEGIFKGIKEDSCFYFVHSFMLECDPKFITAVTDHGCTVTAAIQRGLVFAAQFHPEKSQANGLRLLKNFIERVALEATAKEVHA
jgi:glutamine amidotransferase